MYILSPIRVLSASRMALIVRGHRILSAIRDLSAWKMALIVRGPRNVHTFTYKGSQCLANGVNRQRTLKCTFTVTDVTLNFQLHFSSSIVRSTIDSNPIQFLGLDVVS